MYEGEFDDFLDIRDDIIAHPKTDCWFVNWFWVKVKECEYDANAEWKKIRAIRNDKKILNIIKKIYNNDVEQCSANESEISIFYKTKCAK